MWAGFLNAEAFLLDAEAFAESLKAIRFATLDPVPSVTGVPPKKDVGVVGLALLSMLLKPNEVLSRGRD